MSCQLWWEWWHPRRSLFQSCMKNHLHDNWLTRKHIERHIRGDRAFAFVIVVHLVIWSSESSQMILDLKKHGSSCHWIPSLYLVDGVHAMWRLIEVELCSYSRNVIMLNKHLPTCCWGLQDKPHRRTPEGRRLWVRSGPSRSRACRPSDLRSCPAVSCPPGQSCWEWSTR